MKFAFRWLTLALLLCAVSAAAQEGPRKAERLADKPHFVDGVAYDFSELGQFDRLEMYWVVEKDAVYGFTTPEAVQAFGKERAANKPRPKQIVANDLGSCSGFNKNVGCGGTDWLILCPPNQNAHLSDSWNDVISCVDAGSSVGKYTVLYKCYYFSAAAGDCYAHILWVSPGTVITDLNAYSMNNYTSSIRFCSNIDPYSCS